jgi:hypothetical protein
LTGDRLPQLCHAERTLSYVSVFTEDCDEKYESQSAEDVTGERVLRLKTSGCNCDADVGHNAEIQVASRLHGWASR